MSRPVILAGERSAEPPDEIAAIVLAASASATSADLTEIFVSVQGEGVVAGQVHLFLRFAGCDLRCSYCDTPGSLGLDQVDRGVRIGGGLLRGQPRREPNPVTQERLLQLVDEAVEPLGHRPMVALTGGEPLLRTPYLVELLPALRARGHEILLETAGTRVENLERVVSWIDLVSMDLKLPSVSGEADLLGAHRAFLEVARNADRRIQVKVVIDPRLDLAELERGVRLVAEQDSTLPFILQPEFRSLRTTDEAHRDLIREAVSVARARLTDVRVLPQLHKYLGML